MNQLSHLANQFNIEGELADTTLYGTGHIHVTHLATFSTPDGKKRFIFQRINHHVFKDPQKVMQNIERITKHIRAKVIEKGGNQERECLNIIPSRSDETFVVDDDGSYWRVFDYIEGTSTYDVPENPSQIYEAARAFGNYQKYLSDLPGDRLHDTIPDFHNTPLRFATMVQAIQKDPLNRAVKIKDEIAFVLDREQDTKVIADLLTNEEIPERVNHNDAKLSNVLLDNSSGNGICVIDLDTTMSGTPLYDFGDMVRTGASTAAEDERDLSRVEVDIELFQQMAWGYLEESQSNLTPTEIQHLAFAGLTITLEQGIRFLTDFLEGDIYYRINFPEHNLARTRTQLALVADIERKMDNLEQIVQYGRTGEAHG